MSEDKAKAGKSRADLHLSFGDFSQELGPFLLSFRACCRTLGAEICKSNPDTNANASPRSRDSCRPTLSSGNDFPDVKLAGTRIMRADATRSNLVATNSLVARESFVFIQFLRSSPAPFPPSLSHATLYPAAINSLLLTRELNSLQRSRRLAGDSAVQLFRVRAVEASLRRRRRALEISQRSGARRARARLPGKLPGSLLDPGRETRLAFKNPRETRDCPF